MANTINHMEKSNSTFANIQPDPAQSHSVTSGTSSPADGITDLTSVVNSLPEAHNPCRRMPRPPLLDARLRAAADWVTPCDVCADIGCDHGRLGAALLLENRCSLLLAADISAKALTKAQARMATLGLEDRTVFSAADGLDALDALLTHKADTICILGMGGETLAGILERGRARLAGATLILGAQTELPITRKALETIGYRIVQERVISVDGRLYVLMLANPAQEPPHYTKLELTLGPCLLRELPAEWRPWLIRRHDLLSQAVEAMQKAVTQNTSERMREAQWELNATNDALLALSTHATPAKAEKEAT